MASSNDVAKSYPAFEQAMDTVRAYVAENPAIEITATSTAIPRQYREEFFDKLKSARLALAREVLGVDEFSESCRQHVAQVRQRLEEAYGLTVSIPAELEVFCGDALDGASTLSTSDLLSMLQHPERAEGLTSSLVTALTTEHDRLSKAAFELWVYLKVIDSFKPKRIYSTRTFDEQTVVLAPVSSHAVGSQEYSALIRIPELVIECDQGVFAFKFELASEIDFYGDRPLRRRDYSTGGDSRDMVGRRYTLVYRCADLDSVPVTANRDTGHMVFPLAMFATIFPGDMDTNLFCRATIQRMQTLKCLKGAYFADPLGCADDIRRTCEPCGVEPTIGESGFNDAGLEGYCVAL